MSDKCLEDCRILILEDEYLLADDLREALEGAGAVVLGPMPDVRTALEFLAEGDPIDAAILDINLGGETSYSVADELLRRHVPFLFTSGYDGSTLPEQYRHITRCLKPVRLDAVRDAIKLAIYPP